MDRFTVGFTIKDSPDFFINVAAWGNGGYINGLASSFSIGDCGEKFSLEAPTNVRICLECAELKCMFFECVFFISFIVFTLIQTLQSDALFILSSDS